MIDSKEVVDKIKQKVTDFLTQKEVELVELIFRREGRRKVLRLLVDKPQGGISLDELAGLNQAIGQLLDEAFVLEESYILEVSSPGLDRPLKTKRDFQRVIGKKISVMVLESIEGKKDFVGELERVEEEDIILRLKDREVEIPLDRIIKAKQVVVSKSDQ